MAGAAITIALQQLKGLLGINKFTKKTDIISVMHSVWGSVEHGGKRNKKLFWVPAISPLISVIIATFFVYITHADKDGVAIEAVAIGRTFASMKDYQLDGNKEMVALGTMNVVGSFTSCYVATGSFSRSAVNYMAGCNTAVSNIVMSCVVLLTLFVITPLFYYTPNAILASIIISAVVGLIDIDAIVLIWKIDKFDFIACMGAFFGVVFVTVEIGLLIADCDTWEDPEDYSLQEHAAISRRNQGPGAADSQTVTDIDTSGIHALKELYRSLQKRDIQLIIANPGQAVIDKLHAAEFMQLIGEDNIFLTVADATKMSVKMNFGS
ncbi:hypothetical protein LguiA_008631 [Lonicera macranthoides]